MVRIISGKVNMVDEGEINENKSEKKEEGWLLTTKEARSRIAGIFLSKRRKVNDEIKRINQDENMPQEGKKLEIDKLNESFYNSISKVERGWSTWKDPHFGEFGDALSETYWRSYIKRSQIKWLENQLKFEEDPEKRKLLEEQLRGLKQFYSETKYLKVESNKEDEWIDWHDWKWENGLFDGKTFDEICDWVRKNGCGFLSDSEFYRFYKYLSDQDKEKFFDAVGDGWFPQVDGNNRIFDRAAKPRIFERRWWLKENDCVSEIYVPDTRYNELKELLEVIQKTGGLKEWSYIQIWFPFWSCCQREHYRLINSLINEATTKWVNSTIRVFHGDDFRDYVSWYWYSLSEWMKMAKKEEEGKRKWREKQKIGSKPKFELGNYKNLELSDENIQKVIDIEWKKLKDSIVWDYDEYKKVTMEESVESVIGWLLRKIWEFCKWKPNITLEMIWWAVIWIWKEILRVYKYPYYLHQQPKEPCFSIDDMSLSEAWLSIKTRYITGVSWTWVEGMKVDDPDYRVREYLVWKRWGIKMTREYTYNMRDLYK